MRRQLETPLRWWVLGAALAVAGTAAAVLYCFNPAESSFYPVCMVHKLTGLSCPGCGSLRAMHQLLHGNIAAAFKFNALLMLTLPLGVWLAFRELVWQAWGRRLPALVLRPVFGWVLLTAMVLFGVLRNL